MKSTAADRFMNRTRPTVDKRVDEVSASLQSSTGSPDIEADPTPDKPMPVRERTNNNNNSATAPVDFGISALERELASLPKVANFQLRVEEGYKRQIQQAADQAGVTPETLLQGLWAVAQDRTGLLEDAITEARIHHARRARAQELKPAITRAKRTAEKLGL